MGLDLSSEPYLRVSENCEGHKVGVVGGVSRCWAAWAKVWEVQPEACWALATGKPDVWVSHVLTN